MNDENRLASSGKKARRYPLMLWFGFLVDSAVSDDAFIQPEAGFA